MTNHTYAPMISYLDVQRHEYQVDHLYKQIIHDTDTNSSKKLSKFSREDGLEITFQVQLYNKNVTQRKETFKKRAYRPYSRFKPDQGPVETEKSFEEFPGENSIVRKKHVAYKNSKPGEPAHICNGRGYITVERSVNRLVLLLTVDEKEQQSS